jgi:hypothetical protein
MLPRARRRPEEPVRVPPAFGKRGGEAWPLGQATFSDEDDFDEEADGEDDDESLDEPDELDEDAESDLPESPLDDEPFEPLDELPTVEDDLPEPRLSVR